MYIIYIYIYICIARLLQVEARARRDVVPARVDDAVGLRREALGHLVEARGAVERDVELRLRVPREGGVGRHAAAAPLRMRPARPPRDSAVAPGPPRTPPSPRPAELHREPGSADALGPRRLEPKWLRRLSGELLQFYWYWLWMLQQVVVVALCPQRRCTYLSAYIHACVHTYVRTAYTHVTGQF